MKKHVVLFLTVILFGWQSAEAQWSSNAASNTQFTNVTGEQVIPKIAVCSDGSAYIGWFSNEAGNYNVRLQRIDKDGNIQWEPNGILISDKPQMSWLTDWDMAADAEDYALVTFQDIRNTDNNPVGYRISPEGTMMWGDDGIMLSNNANFEPNPKVCSTAEGNAVFAWPSETDNGMEIHLQKVSPGGELLWGDGIVFSGTDEYTYPFLMPETGDRVFLIWHKESGPFWSPDRGLYVQLLDGDGAPVWDNDLEVHAPVPSGVVITLQLCRDDSGGIIFSWYRNDEGMHFNCYLQHMDAEGNLTMPDDLVVSTSMERNHMYPAPAFVPETQEVVVFFSEQDLNQIQRGLYAQKFDLSGNRQWSDEGKQLIALSDKDYSLPMAGGLNDKAICIYEAYEFGNVTDSKMQAVMLDSDGNFVWPEQFVDMSIKQSSKLHAVMTGYYFGQWVAVWEDQRNDGGDIYAQNIQPDGTLGLVVTSIENHSAGYVNVTAAPNPFSDHVTFDICSPDNGKFTLEIFDLTGKKTGIFSGTKEQNNVSLSVDTEMYPPGFYFYHLNINNEDTYGKLVKK
jgi:hypothetical protein